MKLRHKLTEKRARKRSNTNQLRACCAETEGLHNSGQEKCEAEERYAIREETYKEEYNLR